MLPSERALTRPLANQRGTNDKRSEHFRTPTFVCAEVSTHTHTRTTPLVVGSIYAVLFMMLSEGSTVNDEHTHT